MTIEDTPPPPISAERSTRRRRVAIALAAGLAAGVAVVAAAFLGATHRPSVEWYQTHESTLEVPYWLGSGERPLWQRVDEGEHRVVVDLMAVATVPPGVPRDASSHERVAVFELDAPVGDRDVVTSDGTVLRPIGVE